MTVLKFLLLKNFSPLYGNNTRILSLWTNLSYRIFFLSVGIVHTFCTLWYGIYFLPIEIMDAFRVPLAFGFYLCFIFEYCMLFGTSLLKIRNKRCTLFTLYALLETAIGLDAELQSTPRFNVISRFIYCVHYCEDIAKASAPVYTGTRVTLVCYVSWFSLPGVHVCGCTAASISFAA